MDHSSMHSSASASPADVQLPVLKNGRLKVFTAGLIRENPVLVLLLGTCPVLAVSTNTTNSFGMGLAATFVLLMSNIAISALRKIIPDKVRIPCYIVVIAGFVTIVELLLEAYAYSLYEALGIYLPLIVVNCIILGRAEMFANKNTVADSALDGIGMGLGFTIAIICFATLREVFGAGTWFGIEIPWLKDNNTSVMTMAPGGFIVYGILIAVVYKLLNRKPPEVDSCVNCPVRGTCTHPEREQIRENKLRENSL